MIRRFTTWLMSLLLAAGCGTRAATLRASDGRPPVDSTDDGLSLNIFRAIVRARVLRSFERLNAGDPGAALALMAPDVRYRFDGDHALGGERVTRTGVQRWFGRLLRLFRSHFVLRSVEVTGWPWAATVYTVFEDHVTPLRGAPYVNHGVQIVDLRWGKASRIRTLVNTARLVRALDVMAAAGIAEASAAPIVE